MLWSQNGCLYLLEKYRFPSQLQNLYINKRHVFSVHKKYMTSIGVTFLFLLLLSNKLRRFTVAEIIPSKMHLKAATSDEEQLTG